MSDSFDPFQGKFKARQLKVLLDLGHFRRGLNTSGVDTDTSLIKLVLLSHVEISNAQFIAMLSLNPKNHNHMQVYSAIMRLVDQVVIDILQLTRTTNLIDFPLTNLKEACYEIARTFKPIFFIPRYQIVTSELRSSYLPSTRSSGSDSTVEDVQYEIFKNVERFNQMWILVAMIKDKFNKLQSPSGTSTGFLYSV